MKKNLLIIPGILALCLASCVKEGDLAKKRSVSVGRFGVRYNNIVPGAPEAAAVPEAEAPVEKKAARSSRSAASSASSAEPESSPSLPASQGGKDEGIRLPNMLGLPEDRDLKATNPAAAPTKEQGGVISRPPVEKKD